MRPSDPQRFRSATRQEASVPEIQGTGPARPLDPLLDRGQLTCISDRPGAVPVNVRMLNSTQVAFLAGNAIV